MSGLTLNKKKSCGTAFNVKWLSLKVESRDPFYLRSFFRNLIKLITGVYAQYVQKNNGSNCIYRVHTRLEIRDSLLFPNPVVIMVEH